jgi:hypothetical protein
VPRRCLLAGAALLALLAGCADPPAAGQLAPSEAAAVRTVFLIGAGWHTEIGLDADLLDGRFAPLLARFPGVRVFTFGFGERVYVQERDHTVLHMLRALLPSEGLVLVTALKALPEAAFGREAVVAVPVTESGLQAVEDFVWRSLSETPTGRPVFVGDGPYPGSAFYASPRTYWGLYTCNTWTVDALRAGGIPVTVETVVFASQVTGQIGWRYAEGTRPQ